MYFTGDNSFLKKLFFSQFFLAFSPILNLLILGHNDEVTNWISTDISPKKLNRFDPSLAPVMSNLANGRINIKFNNSVLVQKNYHSL